MAAHSRFLPGKSHGQGSLVGYSPWGKRAGHNWGTNTTVRAKKKTGSNPHDLRLGKAFLDMRLKPQMSKNNNMGFIKFKNFCASKATIKKVKRQHREWLKIF